MTDGFINVGGGVVRTAAMGGGQGNALYMRDAGGAVVAPSAVAVGSEATEIAGASVERVGILIYNNGPDTVYIGADDTVADTNGLPLTSGRALSVAGGSNSWYGICADGETADVRVMERS